MMESAARKLDVRAVFQEFGELVAVDRELFTVRTALAEVKARRALGCLVAPLVGDRVLVAVEERGDAFVLSVLERGEAAETSIDVDGDLRLRSRSGKVSIAAQEGVELVSPERVRVTTAAVEVSALEGRFVTQALSVIGGAVRAELGKIKLLADTLDAAIERVSQRVERSYRTVGLIDQVRAQHIDYAAAGNAQLRGENAIVSADDLVKVNGEQVHIG